MKSVKHTETKQKPAKQQEPQPKAQVRQRGAQASDGKGAEPESAIELITFDENGRASDEKAPKARRPAQQKPSAAPKQPRGSERETQKPEPSKRPPEAKQDAAPVRQKAQRPKAEKQTQQRADAEQATDIDDSENQDPYQAAEATLHPEQLADPYQAAAEPERKVPLDQIMIKVSLSPNADEQPRIETQVIHAEDPTEEAEAGEEEQVEAESELKSDTQTQATAQPETLPYPNFDTPNLAYPGPEDAANLQPMILEQLEKPQEIEIEPMVPPSVVQQAYGMELVPAEQAPQESKKPQPVHLSEMNEPRSQADQPDDEQPAGEEYDNADEDEEEDYDGDAADLDTDDDEDLDFEDEEDDDFADGDEDMDDVEGGEEGSEGEMADKQPQVRMQKPQPANGASIGESILATQQDVVNAERVRRDFAAHGEFPSQEQDFEFEPEEQQTVMASVSNQDWQAPEAHRRDEQGDEEQTEEVYQAPDQTVSESDEALEEAEDEDAEATESERDSEEVEASEDSADESEDESERELTAEEKWEQKKESLHQQYAEKVHQRALDIQKDPHAVVREIMQRMLSSDHTDHHSQTVDLAGEQSSQGEARKIADVMTRKVVCALDTISVEQLASIFNQRKITAVPILDSYTHRFVGLMTMETLFSQAFSQKMFDSRDPGTGEQGQGTQLMQRPVKDFLAGLDNSQIQVAPDFGLDEACDLMLENQLEQLVVIDQGEVKGIFSAFDALRLVEGRHKQADSDSQPHRSDPDGHQPSVVKQASRPTAAKQADKKTSGRKSAA